MITLNDARKAVDTLIDFTRENPIFEEFRGDLFDLLNALNEDNCKEVHSNEAR